MNDIYLISSTTYLYLHLFIAKVQISSFPTIEVLKKKKKKNPIYCGLYTCNPFTTTTVIPGPKGLKKKKNVCFRWVI